MVAKCVGARDDIAAKAYEAMLLFVELEQAEKVLVGGRKEAIMVMLHALVCANLSERALAAWGRQGPQSMRPTHA